MHPLLTYLRSLAARIRGRGVGFPPPPDDYPDALVREPRKPLPGGRHSAIALDEPTEIEPVQARGTRPRT
jgi:hypothetical protein